MVQPNYGGAPSGSITFFDGGVSLGSSTVSGGSAQLTVSSLALGSHSITAKYSGDSSFTTSTSATLAQSVNLGATSTTVSANANPSSYGQSVTFTAIVAPAYGGTPTGNVTFMDGGTSLGSSNLSAGVATLSTSTTTLVAGSHAITAKYSGDSHFTVSTSASYAQVVNPAATNTTLASNTNPSTSGQSVTLTAHVSSAISGTLSGSVSFYLDGETTALASVSLSGGSAQYSTNSLAAGTHSLIATFVSTNSNFGGSSSSALTQNVKDFSTSVSPASQTIARGTPGTYTLTVMPIGGLTGNVSLNCSGAPGSTNCSVSPSQVTLNGTNSAQTTVTVTVGQHTTVGTYSLTLKGTSGSLTHTVPVTLVVN
jgi:hypothetical protein